MLLPKDYVILIINLLSTSYAFEFFQVYNSYKDAIKYYDETTTKNKMFSVMYL